ncbi:MAG: hypothetical protein HY906_16180 [Deltaproteobacteria bacterium]|nr:hypothetical protein [Deltaproteobacteria bacterium]
MLRRASLLGVALALALGCDGTEVPPPDPIPTPAIHTPRWAFEPWISKDISSTDDTYAFVAGFRERDIPVGVVVLDSPWETNYHTFVPNPVRYHDFAKLVGDLGGHDIRVVLWMTQMINRSSVDVEAGGDVYDGPSPNYQEAFDRGYLVDHGQDYYWWKGFGAVLRLLRPAGRAVPGRDPRGRVRRVGVGPPAGVRARRRHHAPRGGLGRDRPRHGGLGGAPDRARLAGRHGVALRAPRDRRGDDDHLDLRHYPRLRAIAREALARAARGHPPRARGRAGDGGGEQRAGPHRPRRPRCLRRRRVGVLGRRRARLDQAPGERGRGLGRDDQLTGRRQAAGRERLVRPAQVTPPPSANPRPARPPPAGDGRWTRAYSATIIVVKVGES